jgi:hypothetical protein
MPTEPADTGGGLDLFGAVGTALHDGDSKWVAIARASVKGTFPSIYDRGVDESEDDASAEGFRSSFEQELDELAREIDGLPARPASEVLADELARAAEHERRLDELDRLASALYGGLFVPGVPSGYDSGEKKRRWRAQLLERLPEASPAFVGTGCQFEFTVPAPRPDAKGFDLDNLLDVPFSCLVNAKGWFEGKRRNVLWFAAAKAAASSGHGCRITLPRRPPERWVSRRRPASLDATYDGPPPRRGEQEYADWVERSKLRDLPPGPVGVGIEMPRATANIAEIADGPVKVLIDGLWPLLGGSPRAPADERVERLFVRQDRRREGVAVRVVPLPAG